MSAHTHHGELAAAPNNSRRVVWNFWYNFVTSLINRAAETQSSPVHRVYRGGIAR
jgi:hypothetical protein